ncbi:DUF2986 domain-containing protein [Pseudoalteromonas aurantia]|uniref:DUF2986 domain-containing protein n=1 Tax=Pseudoalteromonas aurantia TaxID=43654 RepID=A0A5S3V7Y5_9GAMM|nr:DUF2986 domain-containing protein [Pseudoalteromonas aurantia]TMO55834.1 DUF2986 domain-containing protein [Pseudoalteromonas aurantia]TMO67941.1 DUF2986 domain-containing protein [Pseudoalteromonas aurantia]TMO73814.1 DUF2986 domain-containing protein [Pseudoalteromonas aurantia]
MNRKKKIYEKLKKKDKRANAKLHKSNKPRYVSKADRAKQVDNTTTQDSTSIELTE